MWTKKNYAIMKLEIPERVILPNGRTFVVRYKRITQPANIGPQDVPKTSPYNVPRTSPKDPIWPSGDVPIWRLGDVPIWCPGDVLKWRPGDVLIWRSRDIPGRLIRDVPKTFSGRRLEDLESTETCMSKFFLNFSFWTYSIDLILIKHFNTQGVLSTQ